MLGIILTGHGHFASGIASAVELIAGKMENLVVVDFEPGDSSDVLEEKVAKAFEQLKNYDSIVVLTDLMGGTPFKTAALLSLKHKNCKVLYGTNLPMILEFVLSVEATEDLEKLINNSLKIGKGQIDEFKLSPQEDVEIEEREGI